MAAIIRIARLAVALIIAVSAVGCRAGDAAHPSPRPVLSATEFLAAATDYPRDGMVEAYVIGNPRTSDDSVEFDVGDDTRADFTVRFSGAVPSDLAQGARVRFPVASAWPGGPLEVESIEVVERAPAAHLIDSLRSTDVSLTLFPRMQAEAVDLLGEGAAAYIIGDDQFGRIHVVETTSTSHAQWVMGGLTGRTGKTLGMVQIYRTDAFVVLYAPNPAGPDIAPQLGRELGEPTNLVLRRK